MNKKQLHSLKQNPRLLLVGLLSTKAFAWFPDKWFLRIVYRCRTGLKLGLKNPTRFNEKLQWLKLYDRKPVYITYVDKYAVREYVKNTIGEEYLIPICGVWDSADEINFDELPEKCVLKCTHDSGSSVVVDRFSDPKKVKRKLKHRMSINYYLRGREWPYKNVKRRIIGELFMEDSHSNGLNDYKFLCFHGEPRMLTVCSDKTEMGLKVTYLDLNWNQLPFEGLYPASNHPMEKPEKFELMLVLCRKLAEGMPFLRVDLYEIDGKVYFSELTLYHECGFEKFRPDEWDEKLGELLTL